MDAELVYMAHFPNKEIMPETISYVFLKKNLLYPRMDAD